MSETTEVKGQFGLGQSGGTGKKLKLFYFTEMFQAPYMTNKGKQTQLINSFVHSHDLLCSCIKPTFHCLQILAQQLAPELKPEEKQQIIQCLSTATTTTDAAGEDQDDFIGDLEKLFEDDITEEDAG